MLLLTGVIPAVRAADPSAGAVRVFLDERTTANAPGTSRLVALRVEGVPEDGLTAFLEELRAHTPGG